MAHELYISSVNTLNSVCSPLDAQSIVRWMLEDDDRHTWPSTLPAELRLALILAVGSVENLVYDPMHTMHTYTLWPLHMECNVAHGALYA